MEIELGGSRGITLPTLRAGDKGADVKALQKALIEVGFKINNGVPNGVFGPQTTSAVEMYQAQEHLSVDGVAGKNTMKALGFDWKGTKSTPKPTPKPSPAPSPEPPLDQPLTAPMPDYSKYLLWGGVAIVGVMIAKKKGWLKRFKR